MTPSGRRVEPTVPRRVLPGMNPVPRLHLVTDDRVLARPGFVDLASRLLRGRGGGSLALHVRGPATPGGPLLEAAQRLVEGAGPPAEGGRPPGGWVVVNDRLDVALAAGAAGVHLGERSLPLHVARRVAGERVLLGVSVHSAEQAAAAAGAGADWIFAGTIWATASHPGRAGAGPGFLSRVVGAAGTVPVLAIGGVTPERVAEALGAGAWGVAVIRGVWDDPDPQEAVRRYLQELAKKNSEEMKT